MTFPDDEEMAQSQDHSVHFEMKRAPRGHLDVLYLSDTTRVTKGNRGTLVVVEPASCMVEEGPERPDPPLLSEEMNVGAGAQEIEIDVETEIET